MKIIFFGSFGEFSKFYLEAIKNAGFIIDLAVEDKNTNLDTLKDKIKKTQPDIGIIAYFGKIIPDEILKIPKYGFLNAHPSLLPRWRGPSPVQNTILADDKITGITIHLTTNKIDAGDILSQKEILVLKTDTCFSLTKKLAIEGAKLLVETIKNIENIKPYPQNSDNATFTKLIKKSDGLIDWSKPADYIERMVRAYDPWPGTYTYVEIKNKNSKFKIFLKIKMVEVLDEKIKIVTVQPEGKKEMSFDAFLRGHPEAKIN